jgi:hypothetical protein
VTPAWWPQGSGISLTLLKEAEWKVGAVAFHVPQIRELSAPLQVGFSDSAPLFSSSNIFRGHTSEELAFLNNLRDATFSGPVRG